MKTDIVRHAGVIGRVVGQQVVIEGGLEDEVVVIVTEARRGIVLLLWGKSTFFQDAQ